MFSSALMLCPQAGHASAARRGCSAALRRRRLAAQLGALRLPAALEHLRQAVDHDVEEAADAKPDGGRATAVATAGSSKKPMHRTDMPRPQARAC